MRASQGLKIFGVALAIGSIVNLAPFYVGMFSKGESFRWKPIYQLLEDRTPFGDKYTLRKSEWNLGVNDRLSLGIVRPSLNVWCEDYDGNRVEIAANINRANAPISFSSKEIAPCKDEIKFEIPSIKEVGVQSSGFVISGSEKFVSKVESLEEFGAEKLRIVLMVIVFLALFVERRNLELGIKFDEDVDFAPNVGAWLLFLGFSSGMVQWLVPIDWKTSHSLVLLYFLSAFCHLQPLIETLLSARLSKRFRYALLFLLSFLLVASPNVASTYALVGVLLSVIVMVVRRRGSTSRVFWYALSIVLTFGKIGLWPSVVNAYLPHWHFASIYIAVHLAMQVAFEFGAAAPLYRAIRFTQGLEGGRRKPRDSSVIEVLTEMSEALSSTKVTLLTIKHNHSCTIETVVRSDKSTVNSTKQLAVIPPVFAHAVTSGKTLFHVDERGTLAARLRKKGNTEPQGFRFFSVVPLVGESGELGALGITGYDLEEDRKRERFNFESALRTYSAYLSRVLELSNSRALLENEKTFEEALNALRDLKLVDDLSPLEASLNALYEGHGLSGFIGFVSHEEGSIWTPVTSGLSEEATVLLRGLKLIANNNNDHGPIPLAVHTGDPTYANDLSIVEHLLTGSSQEFLKLSGARSLAVVPFDYSDTLGQNVRAIVYASSPSERCFDGYMRSVLESFASALAHRFNELIILAKKSTAEERLATFVPQNVRERLLRGLPVTQKREGFLVCVDLIGSTALGTNYENEMFRSFIREIQRVLESSCKTSESELLLVIWDAFFIHSNHYPDDFINSVSRLNNAISDIALRCGFSKEHSEKVAVRVAISYGDCTCDFENFGPVRNWTIVGGAMATVSKLEDAVKPFGPGVFCDDLVLKQVGAPHALNEVEKGRYLIEKWHSKSN